MSMETAWWDKCACLQIGRDKTGSTGLEERGTLPWRNKRREERLWKCGTVFGQEKKLVWTMDWGTKNTKKASSYFENGLRSEDRGVFRLV